MITQRTSLIWTLVVAILVVVFTVVFVKKDKDRRMVPDESNAVKIQSISVEILPLEKILIQENARGWIVADEDRMVYVINKPKNDFRLTNQVNDLNTLGIIGEQAIAQRNLGDKMTIEIKGRENEGKFFTEVTFARSK